VWGKGLADGGKNEAKIAALFVSDLPWSGLNHLLSTLYLFGTFDATC
jgi:hypothetical protein